MLRALGNLQEQYVHWIVPLGQTQKQLLAVYKESNEQARSEPVPDYFNQNVEIDHNFVEPPIFNPPEPRNDQEVIEAVRDATDKINVIAEDVLEEFDSVVQQGIQ